MSHVADVELVISDLDALATACERLGLELRLGQKTHGWWGQWMNDWRAKDSAVAHGRDPKQFGKCDHAIGIKGSGPGTNGASGNWEIGLVARADGKGYDAVYDIFGTSGEKLTKRAGKNLDALAQEYGAEVAIRRLKRQRFNVTLSKDEMGRTIVKATK